MVEKQKTVKGQRIQLSVNPFGMWTVIITKDDVTIFSAVYFKRAIALKAYRQAYNCIIANKDIEEVYND